MVWQALGEEVGGAEGEGEAGEAAEGTPEPGRLQGDARSPHQRGHPRGSHALDGQFQILAALNLDTKQAMDVHESYVMNPP